MSRMMVLNRKETRIDQLEVQIQSRGTWMTVYNESGLREQETIEISWPEQEMDEIRLIIKRNFLDEHERNIADIEEIIFPGYQAVIQGGE